MKKTTLILTAAILALSAGAAQAQQPRANIVDERADRMFTMIERDLEVRTGMQTEITQIDLFNGRYESAPGTTTYCGLVRYDGGPEVPFVIRTEPARIVQVAIRWEVPAERAVWTGAGCERDGSIFMSRPASMIR